MEEDFLIRDEWESHFLAIIDCDGSGRLQSFHKNVTPRFYVVLIAFHARSGLIMPLLVNTGYN